MCNKDDSHAVRSFHHWLISLDAHKVPHWNWVVRNDGFFLIHNRQGYPHLLHLLSFFRSDIRRFFRRLIFLGFVKRRKEKKSSFARIDFSQYMSYIGCYWFVWAEARKRDRKERMTNIDFIFPPSHFLRSASHFHKQYSFCFICKDQI